MIDALVIGSDAPEAEEAAPAKRKPKRKTMTSRALDECRKRGWPAGVVERHIPFPRPQGTTIDLFGVIDVVAIAPGAIVGIQVTSGTNHASRREKILATENARRWIAEGNGRLELWSWSKRGSHFERPHWELRVEVFTLDSAWSQQEVEQEVDHNSDDAGDDDQRNEPGDAGE